MGPQLAPRIAHNFVLDESGWVGEPPVFFVWNGVRWVRAHPPNPLILLQTKANGGALQPNQIHSKQSYGMCMGWGSVPPGNLHLEVYQHTWLAFAFCNLGSEGVHAFDARFSTASALPSVYCAFHARPSHRSTRSSAFKFLKQGCQEGVPQMCKGMTPPMPIANKAVSR